jgi:hypothetical protein
MLAAMMGDGGVAVQDLTQEFADGFIGASEYSAGLGQIASVTFDAQEATYANAEAMAFATESTATLTASLWQMSDAQLVDIETKAQAALESNRLEQFQLALASAADAAAGSQIAGAFAAAQLSSQYGIQLPRVNALIAAHNNIITPIVIVERFTFSSSLDRRSRGLPAALFISAPAKAGPLRSPIAAPVLPCGHFVGGTIATARSGPPLPPPIFIGSAMIVAPRAGSRCSSVRFSNAGTSRANSARCVSNSVDCP